MASPYDPIEQVDPPMSIEDVKRLLAAATPGPFEAYDPMADEHPGEPPWYWVWRTAKKPYYGGTLKMNPPSIFDKVGDKDLNEHGMASVETTDGRDPAQEKADAEFFAAAPEVYKMAIALAKENEEYADLLRQAADALKDAQNPMVAIKVECECGHPAKEHTRNQHRDFCVGASNRCECNEFEANV